MKIKAFDKISKKWIRTEKLIVDEHDETTGKVEYDLVRADPVRRGEDIEIVYASGLCDCDGNELYTGHIITVLNTPEHMNPNVEVIFNAGMFGFVQPTPDEDRKTFFPLAKFVPKYVKLIGDKFTSPELLSEEAGKKAHNKMFMSVDKIEDSE